MTCRTTSTLACLFILTGFALPLDAAIIWTGPTVTFTKEIGTDPSLAENQDYITPAVILTRGTWGQLYNVAADDFPPDDASPLGVEFADGDLADWATLSYDTLSVWGANEWDQYDIGGEIHERGGIGRPVVMHLIAEDIYLGLEWNWWSFGNPDRAADAGAPHHDSKNDEPAGFSYTRTTPVPEPSTLGMLCLLSALGIAAAGWRRRNPLNKP